MYSLLKKYVLNYFINQSIFFKLWISISIYSIKKYKSPNLSLLDIFNIIDI